MDIVDKDLVEAERAATNASAEIERVPTATQSTSGSSTSSAPSVIRQEIGTGTDKTTAGGQRIHRERSATALSRIHTQRSQHSGTVGRTVKTRDERKPLPEFGAGKSYPPPLPDREEYVVEFDGEHDPRHAMNWSMKKK